MGKYKGVRKRPSDSREMTLETFMPGGKLSAMPLKQSQIVVILEEIARKFEPEKQYTEREVNVILEEINEDYCTTRRYLVDYGYLSRTRDGSVYYERTRNTGVELHIGEVMMEIKLAKEMGMCFGVKMTLDQIDEAIQTRQGGIDTLGTLVHNPQLVEKLGAQRIAVVERP